jgi:flagellar protein FliO/FliZ
MQAVTFFLAFVAVLALIGVAAWLVRRFASNRLGTNTNRGRMPRLAVIDAAAVDGRRRLVLVRRDNIEHLLMIGGPTDIVVEANIVRATPQREQLPARPGATEAPPARVVPLPDAASWLEGDGARSNGFDHHHEPQMPEPPPRPVRPSFADEIRRVPPAAAERRGDPLTAFSAEPLAPPRLEPRPEQRIEPRGEPRLEPRSEPRSSEPRSEPRHEPRPEPVPPRIPRGEPMMPRSPRLTETAKAPLPMRPPERSVAPPPPPPPPPPAPPPSADQNLAEMAQRLEAALRRPGSDAAPPVAPETPPPPARVAQRNEPPASPLPPGAAPKSTFENLEDEMASLLGRPKSSSSS